MAAREQLITLLDRVREQAAAGTPDLSSIVALQAALSRTIEDIKRDQIQQQYQAALQLAKEAGYERLEDLITAANGQAPLLTQPMSGRHFVKPLYRDPAGNTWSGRGRPPRWLQLQIEEKIREGISEDNALAQLKDAYRIRH